MDRKRKMWKSRLDSNGLLSVHIPVRNKDKKRLNLVISHILDNHDGLVKEITVIDYGSDIPVKGLDKDVKIIRVESDEFNKSHALNLSMKQSTTPFVMHIDADILLTKKHFSEIWKSISDDIFIVDTNVRRIDMKDYDKDFDKMIKSSLPWNNEDRNQYVNQTNGGFQLYPKSFFDKVGGICESLGKYWGAEDGFMFFQARLNDLTIVDLSYPILHISHQKSNQVSKDCKEFIIEWINFKSHWLDFMVKTKLKKNPESFYAKEKPCMELFENFKSLINNRENTFKCCIDKGIYEFEYMLEKYKLEKQKPSILITVIHNYEVIPTFFLMELFNLYSHTRQFYPCEFKLVNACDVNVMRNLSVLHSLGKLGGKKFDYLVQLDSVTPETPILVRKGGFLDFVEIQDLTPTNTKWTTNINGEKLYSYGFNNIEVMTKNGWKKVKYVMKHKVNKPIYTLGGDCVTRTTGDHSLFKNNKEIKPSNLKEEDKIDKILYKENPKNQAITKEHAKLLGFFCAEGTAGVYYNKEGKEPNKQWSLYNTNLKLLESFIPFLEGYYNKPFKILTATKSTDKNKTCYKLVQKMNRDNITDWFMENCYSEKSRLKKVPQIILNSSNDIIESFLDGYLLGDGHINKVGQINYNTNSFILSAGLNYLYQRLGKNTRHFIRPDKPNIIATIVNKTKKTKDKGINKILKEDYNGYVYDICTEDGTFVGGVGNVLFKNTDQIYDPSFLVRFLDLMTKNKWDILVGLSPSQRPPHNNLQYYSIEGDINRKGNQVFAPKPIDKQIQIECSGPSGMVINTKVFDKLEFPYYQQTYEADLKEGKSYKNDKGDIVFKTTGGDINFSKQLKKAKIPIYCDLKTNFPHKDPHSFFDRNQKKE